MMIRRIRPDHLSAAVLLVLLEVFAFGCYRAPELSGNDQVFDPNIEATILKDNDLAALAWPEVDDYMEGILPNPAAPGCAVGLARGGKLTYLQGYGKAVIGGEDWSVGTMGAVGSVSKTFTAVAMLRMHELSMLNVNHSVGAYLNTTNNDLGNTMLARLLTHSSGVGGASQGAAFSPNWEAGSPADNCIGIDSPGCDFVSSLLVRPAVAFNWYEANEAVAELTDGDHQNGILDQGVYSNVGYSVAGAVVDRVAQGTPSGGYEAWIWDRIGVHTGNLLLEDNLLSLALTHSWRATDIPHRAIGYVQNGGGFDLDEAFDPDGLSGLEGWEGPAGGWALTIGDLTRFVLALNTEKIIGPSYLNAMRWQWTNLDGFGADDYGMGVMLGLNGSRPPYWHGGTIGGHNAMWGWWDDYNGSGQSLAVTMMCNRNISPFSLATHAVNIAGDIPGTFPKVSGIAQLPPIEPARMPDATFELDFSKAWQAAPKGVVTPLGLNHRLVLEVRASGAGLAMALSEGDASGGRMSIRRTHRLGNATEKHNPYFASRPTSIELSSRYGEIALDAFEVSGAISTRGKGMSGITLGGIIDLRKLGSAGGNWRDVCRGIQDAKPACRPCDDGIAACVQVRYEGIEARALKN